MNVDTTFQEKAVSFSTDAKLYYKMLEVLVGHANKKGISLRQSYKIFPKDFAYISTSKEKLW